MGVHRHALLTPTVLSLTPTPTVLSHNSWAHTGKALRAGPLLNHNGTPASTTRASAKAEGQGDAAAGGSAAGGRGGVAAVTVDSEEEEEEEEGEEDGAGEGWLQRLPIHMKTMRKW